MTVTQTSASIVIEPGQQVALSSLFTLAWGLPATIGIDIYDNGQYTNSNPGRLGYLSGNGAQSPISYVSSDGRDYSVVFFQYDAKTGEYYNSSLGYWNDITYVAPTGNDHNEMLSVFSVKDGSTNLITASGFNAGNFNDYGDMAIAVQSSAFVNPFAGATPGQATPDEISAIAMTYIGKVWNNNGCVLLCADIAALAGSSLPFTAQITSAPTPAQGNGEWMVAYDAVTQTNPTYAAAEAVIREGDIVVCNWAKGGGHIFTVVSGSGADAMVVDNTLDQSAKDGSTADIIIQPPHTVAETLANGGDGAVASSIQIYRLDTPVVAAQAAPAAPLAAGSSLVLSTLFSAADPEGKPVTRYEVYDSAAGNSFTVNGTTEAAHSADSAITVGSLSSVSLTVGTGGGSDTLEVRSSNGSYWGDWQTLTVASAPAVTALQAIGAAAVGQVVLDSAQNIVASLDGLAGLAAKGDLVSILLTDGGTPNLTVTAAQWAADGGALQDINSSHTVTLQMSGNAAQHDFSADNLTGISAVQFADQTVIVAAAPGPANAVTTGNITELYSAVLAREPDIGGLAFYQTYLKANPATPLLQFAEWFLSSSEYSAAHHYAQTSAGDTQFIEDSYQNLLHRTPSSDEVNFYLANVMEKGVAGLTAGTQAYQAAEFQAHAQMLVYFSASAEFLSDVQITAQKPASAQHWLVLT